MKKISVLFLTLLLGFVLISCQTDQEDPIDNGDDDNSDVIEEPMSVKEVLEQEDLTYVEFVGYVIGYDLGNRHIVIEDKDDPTYSVQIYKNPGYIFAKVGDEVLVKGYRTFDRSTDRVEPESLEVLSKGNVTSVDNPIVIKGEDLFDWTNENRTNPNILFKFYRFENVEILSTSGSYTYIDDQYDEEGGRGIKIGIKNDSSLYDASNFVVGNQYTFSAILYGSSDDFFDESRDGTVLRLSVLSEEHVEMIVDGEDAVITINGQTSFKVQEENIPINFLDYFTINDPVDGRVEVTEEMITSDIDLTKEGTYVVTVTYTNSNNHTTTKSFNLYVTSDGASVTDFINSELGTEIEFIGLVTGYGLRNDGFKTAMVVSDPENGNSVEMWLNKSIGNFNGLKVGDLIKLKGTRGVEKNYPRVTNYELIEVISSGNELPPAKVIADLDSWSDSVIENYDYVLGRYTFTTKVVENSGSYIYFTRSIGESNFIQIAIHQDSSAVKYDFVVGNTYEVTATLIGVSDPLSALETKSIATRFSIMDESDVKLIEEQEVPTDPTVLSVSDVIESELGTLLEFQGIVTGFGLRNDGFKTAMIVSDPEIGNSVEMWINKSVQGFDDLLVGDLVKIRGVKTIEKNYPRVTSYELIEVISSGNELPPAKVITDLDSWSDLVTENYDYVIGRYTFTAEVVDLSSSYVYFTRAVDDEKFIQIAIHQSSSAVKYDFVAGKTYEVTATLIGVSDPLSALGTKSIATRLSIMDQEDVSLIE